MASSKVFNVAVVSTATLNASSLAAQLLCTLQLWIPMLTILSDRLWPQRQGLPYSSHPRPAGKFQAVWHCTAISQTRRRCIQRSSRNQKLEIRGRSVRGC